MHTDQTCAVSTPFRPAVCAGTTTPRGPGGAAKDSDTAAAPRMQQPQTSVSRQSPGGPRGKEALSDQGRGVGLPAPTAALGSTGNVHYTLVLP